MLVLGISEEHDAGVALMHDGRLVFAVNEERFSRRKLQPGFPKQSLKAAVDFIAKELSNIPVDALALAGRIHISDFEEAQVNPSAAQKTLGVLSAVGFAPSVVGTKAGVEITGFMLRKSQFGRIKRLRNKLKPFGLDKRPLTVYDHHDCHAASAYFTHGPADAAVITLDAAGDGYCSKAYHGSGGMLELVHSVPFFHSIGYYYTLVTFYLGFKAGQQGKVTGLSARGKGKAVKTRLKERIRYQSERMVFENLGRYYMYEMDHLKKVLDGFSREDVAAGIQDLLEESVTNYVTDVVRKHRLPRARLSLAGGVFANVLLNRRLDDLDGIGEVYIHPNMANLGPKTYQIWEMLEWRSRHIGQFRANNPLQESCRTRRVNTEGLILAPIGGRSD